MTDPEHKTEEWLAYLLTHPDVAALVAKARREALKEAVGVVMKVRRDKGIYPFPEHLLVDGIRALTPAEEAGNE